MCRQLGSPELGGKSRDAMVRSGYEATPNLGERDSMAHL